MARESLRDRLNRPGRTAVGRLIRRGVALAPTLGAVGQVLFPGPAALIATGTGLFRGARQGVRDSIQRRTNEVQAAAANQQAATTYVRTVGNVGNWLTRNWMLLLLPVGAVMLLAMMRGTRTRSKPRSKPRSAPRSAPRPKGKTGTGFARRIKGKLYTDPKAWGRAMKNLRRK